MYKVAALTDAQIAKLPKPLRDEIQTLKADSDNFDADLYEVFAENDSDLYDLAKGELASAETAQEPSAAETPKRGPKPREKRAKKQAAPYAETVTISGKEYLVGAHPDGKVQYGLDKNGQLLQVGDTVEVEIKGKTVTGVIGSLKARNGGGHLVRFVDPKTGKKRALMVQPSAVTKTDTAAVPVIEYKKRLPKKLIKKAQVAGRADCDENEVVLVTPTEKVEIEAPTVADPAKGDKILAHPDGTPVTVIKGEHVDQHFEVEGDAKVENQKDGTVVFDLNEDEKPETAAKPQPKDDTAKYRAVKAKKPAAKCAFTQEKAKSPALMTFLEGMRLRWHDGESKDKIVGVYYLKAENKILLKIRVYDWLDLFSDIRYFTLCPETGRLTQAGKPQRANYSVLLGTDAMKEFYRHPFGQSCKRVSKALYVECYRNGTCSTEKQKRLYQVFAGKCIRQEKAYSREYIKWLHQKTAERWEGYRGPKSYAQVFKEVIASIRKGK
ncbi:MAG: hypothetical protein R3D58_07155 [Saprospiraceae bacterium]|nr:hypothetical protein [Lewinellaceae bacterium]